MGLSRLHPSRRWLDVRPAALLGLVSLSALLTGLAYPPLDWRWAAWVVMAPPIFALSRGGGGARFWFAAGWGYGAVFFALRYAWLPEAFVVKGGVELPVFVGIASVGLAVLACYPALAFALTRWVYLRWRISPCWSFPLFYSVQDALLGVTPFGGAPWGSLAATQTTTAVAEWLAPLAGGSSLTLAIVAVNGAWAGAALRPPSGRRQTGIVLAGLAALVLVANWPGRGAVALPDPVAGSKAVPVLAVPGNLPVDLLANPAASRKTLRYYLGRTMAAGASLSVPGSGQGANESPPLLIVWPEAAVAGRVERGQLMQELHQVAKALDAQILLGSNARKNRREYNAAYLVGGRRFSVEHYDKRRLVPFGEYVPSGYRWFFGSKIAAGDDDYQPGAAPPVLRSEGGVIGLAICFESILPGHALRMALEGAEFLAVISNDQWLTPAASRHHMDLTALRALEIGKEVIAATNGGWSGHLVGGQRHGLRLGDAKPLRVSLQRRVERTPWSRWGYASLALAWAAFLTLGVLARAGYAWAPKFLRDR